VPDLPSARTPAADSADALEAQVAARERASAEDARAQASGRLAAAAKAVASLRDGVASPPVDAAPLVAATPVATIDAAGPTGTTGTAGTAVMAGSAESSASTAWEPVADPDRTDPDVPADERPAVPVPTGGPAAVISKVFGAPAPDVAVPDTPLLELRPSALGADVDQLGDQVLVYVDRIEHRDRHGRLKRRMSLRDVTEVEVHRRLTGTLLEVHSHAGVALVVKGLRPEAAEQARELIAAHRPQPRGAVTPARPEFDEAGLLRKLVELYRAGVLDDQELAAKTEVVAALAREVAGRRAATPPA
jgi:hypothetical protein